MPTASAPLPLHGWTVLSLRPRGQHGGLRAAAARLGARVLALSVQAIVARDATTRQALAAALAADVVVFTSPNAVRAAAALMRLHPRRGQPWLAVGSGTRRALQRRGINAQAPARMDSEGLLALPALADVDGRTLGLVTAPGGRDRLAPVLRARGAQVRRADVYARVPVALGARQRMALAQALAQPQQVLLALSSGEALAALLAQVDDPRLRTVAVAAASARLADAARAAGFTRVAVASSARPAALLRAWRPMPVERPAPGA
ncbi:MAG: uroporphyrinogen-III synthase [Thermomonas haemolytica]